MNDYRCDWCGKEATRFFRNNLYLVSCCNDCVTEPKDLPPTSPLTELSIEEFIVAEVIGELPRALLTVDSHGVYFINVAIVRCR
jgi:hypothetical protein